MIDSVILAKFGDPTTRAYALRMLESSPGQVAAFGNHLLQLAYTPDWRITATAPLAGSASDTPVGPSIPSGRRLVEAAYAARRTAWPNGLHGADRWLNVAHNAAVFAPAAGADVEVAALFAVLRDSCRNGTDPDHGSRAADLASRLNGDVFFLDPGRLRLLRSALSETGATCSDPTIGSCWDAYRHEAGPNEDAGGWDDVFDRFRAILGIDCPPRPGITVYHGTHGRAADSIMRGGLRPVEAGRVPSLVSPKRSWGLIFALRTTLAQRCRLYRQNPRDGWQTPGALFELRLPSTALHDRNPRGPAIPLGRGEEYVVPGGCRPDQLVRVSLVGMDEEPPPPALLAAVEAIARRRG